MLLYCHQNEDQKWNIETGNRSFENVLWFKYLGMTVRNQNLIQEGTKKRQNCGDACYHSVQNIFGFLLDV
jgi:hypothetical protein